MKLFPVCALLSVVILVGCDDDDNVTNGQNAGRITVTAVHKSQPLDSAFVMISLSTTPEAEIAASGTTDSGICVFSNVPEGTYTITVSKSLEDTLIYGSQSGVKLASGGSITQTVLVDQQTLDYFPLALGNSWSYSDGTGETGIVGVFTTKVINGVLTYTFGPESGGYPPYLTRSASAVYWHGYETMSGGDHIFPKPVVWIDFLANAGASWTIPDWGTITLQERDLTLTVPTGTYTSCIHLVLSSDAVLTDMWVAPGVGFIKSIDTGAVVSELVDYQLY